jgi:S1-C subfamily serine protease
MRLLAASLLALLLVVPARAQELNAPHDATEGAALEARLQEVAERSRERTVLVYGVIGMGSGAVIDPSGRVVTNAHVAAGARFALVQWADGTTSLCRQVGIDYPADLALLEPVDRPVDRSAVGPVTRPCFTFAPGRPAKGTWVVALGYPGGLGTDPRPTTTLGRVLDDAAGESPAGPALDYSKAVRHDAPIFSGNSGGPLVDLEGRLLGINGAVDTAQAISLTIDIDVVRARLERLARGVVVLPGGVELDRGSPWLQAVYRLLDPFARRLPERVAQGSKAAADDESFVPPGAKQAAGELLAGLSGGAGDRMARTARAQPRQALLDRLQQGDLAARVRGLTARLEGGLLATRVAPDLIVAKASLLPAGPRLEGGGACELVAVSEADDLALLRVPAVAKSGPVAAVDAGATPAGVDAGATPAGGDAGATPAGVDAGATPAGVDAGERAPGSLVHVLSPDGLLASGIVSATPRRASASLAASVASSGLPAPVERAVELLKGLAERLDAAPLRALVEQLEAAMEQRRAFAMGTPPRGYPQVVAIDAPLSPAAVGAPVCDRVGRLVGVAVAIPHHGTTYVVPMARLRVAFGGALPGGRIPDRIGAAKLY